MKKLSSVLALCMWLSAIFFAACEKVFNEKKASITKSEETHFLFAADVSGAITFTPYQIEQQKRGAKVVNMSNENFDKLLEALADPRVVRQTLGNGQVFNCPDGSELYGNIWLFRYDVVNGCSSNPSLLRFHVGFNTNAVNINNYNMRLGLVRRRTGGLQRTVNNLTPVSFTPGTNPGDPNFIAVFEVPVSQLQLSGESIATFCSSTTQIEAYPTAFLRCETSRDGSTLVGGMNLVTSVTWNCDFIPNV